MKFTPQKRNLNKHTPHGMRLLEKSLQQDGFIDAQTAAADGEMISGSARLEVAADKFADVEPIIVESDGTRPVVVVRTDIPNLDDPRARRLSVAANQIAKTDFDPDGELLKEWGDEDKDIKAMFGEDEWEAIVSGKKNVADTEILLDQAIQLEPAKEYIVVMCNNAEEFQRLREIFNLQEVRRGGYRAGSPFDATGIQRVIHAEKMLEVFNARGNTE